MWHYAPVFAIAAIVAAAPAYAAPPIVGAQGLTPAAKALADYILSTYPGVLSIGGVRADALPDHPSGRALDIMIGTDMALGDRIYADLSSHMHEHGIEYLIWRKPAHHNHIHVTVS